MNECLFTKQDGPVHTSKMVGRYVPEPFAVVSPGDMVDLAVLSVDLERGRLGLRMRE